MSSTQSKKKGDNPPVKGETSRTQQDEEKCVCTMPLSQYQIPGNIPADLQNYEKDKSVVHNFYQGLPDIKNYCKSCK